MSKADGTILIDTSINEDGFDTGTKELELAARRVAKSVQDIGEKAKISLQKQVDSFSKLNSQYAQQEKRVESLKKKLDELKEQKIPTKEYTDIGKEIDRLNTALDKAIERQIKFVETGGSQNSRAFSAMEYDIEKLKSALNEAIAKKTQLENSGGAYSVADAWGIEEKLLAESEKLKNLNDRLNTSYMSLKQAVASYGGNLDILKSQTTGYVGVAQSLKGSLDVIVNAFLEIPAVIKGIPKAAFNGLISSARRLAEGLKQAVKRIREASVYLAQMAGKRILSGLKKISSGILGINKASNKTTLGLKRMISAGLLMSAVYRAFSSVVSATKEGFQNLAQYSDETNSALSTLMSSLTQLKNSLAAAFSPILTTIAPALNYLISMVTAATNAIARLMAALTGKSSVVQATKVQQDYADSLAATGDAASTAGDDAQKALAPFDDLVQIQTQESSSSSGSGSSSSDLSPSEMFETVDIDPISFDSWGEAFDAFLDYLLNSGIPALESALASMADWINSFSNNLYEMFTFPGVREKVQQLGVEVGEAFNDFTNQIEWDTIGKALGAGFDLAIQFLVNLIWTYDWNNLGESLATSVNNAIEQVEWYSFGQLLWAKFKIALETFAGFINGLDMPELAQAASDVAIGFFNSISETLINIDWQSLGKQIATFIANIDYSGIADSFFYAVGVALASLAEFLWGLIGDAWNSVVTWWHDTAYEDGQFTIVGLLNGILDVLASIGQWIVDHIFTPIINGFKDAFGISSPSTVMQELGGYLMEGLILGIKNFIISIIEIFLEIKNKIVSVLEGIGNALQSLSDWINNNQAIVENFTIVVASFFAAWGVVNLATTIAGVVTALTAFVTTGGLAAAAATALGTAIAVLTSPITIVVAIIGSLIAIGVLLYKNWDEIKEAAASLARWFGEKWDWIKNKTSEVWEGIKSKLSQTWENIKTTCKTKFTEIKNNIQEKWQNVKTDTAEKWDNIKTNLGTVWENVRTTASTKFAEIKEKIADAWQQTKQDTSTKWDNIKTDLATAWNYLKENGGTTFETLKDSVVAAWEDLKENTGTIWDGIVGVIKGCINGIISAVESMVNTVIDAVNWVIKQINKIEFDNPITGEPLIDFNIPTLDKVTLPRLASGTVIPPRAGEFAAILGDNNRETEVVSPVSAIKEALLEAMQEAGGLSGTEQNITIRFEGSMSSLARALKPELDRETARRGTNLVVIGGR